jgi:hypothetical protein
VARNDGRHSHRCLRIRDDRHRQKAQTSFLISSPRSILGLAQQFEDQVRSCVRPRRCGLSCAAGLYGDMQPAFPK